MELGAGVAAIKLVHCLQSFLNTDNTVLVVCVGWESEHISHQVGAFYMALTWDKKSLTDAHLGLHWISPLSKIKKKERKKKK